MADKRHTTFGELRVGEHFTLPGKAIIWRKKSRYTASAGPVYGQTSTFTSTMPVERVGSTLITPP